jgi:hypothetical protein
MSGERNYVTSAVRSNAAGSFEFVLPAISFRSLAALCGCGAERGTTGNGWCTATPSSACIREVLGSILGWNTNYSKLLRSSPSLQANAERVPPLFHYRFLSNPFQAAIRRPFKELNDQVLSVVSFDTYIIVCVLHNNVVITNILPAMAKLMECYIRSNIYNKKDL